MHVFDPLYGRIEIEADRLPIFRSRWFRRLHRLRQMGLCYLSFPGGNHTRYEHCLGTAHVARMMALDAVDRSFLNEAEKRRLVSLVSVAAMCHDIGHGPFSHMTENALHGLGVRVTHEEVGGAIVRVHLQDELSPLNAIGITPHLVSSVFTHSNHNDPIARAATTWVTSDLDADRIDYLNRDSYYTRAGGTLAFVPSELRGIWAVERVAGEVAAVLTEKGVRFAEKMLLLRRDNYRSIVYESRHMAATGMFEKAVVEAVAHGGEFADLVAGAKSVDLDISGDDLEALERQLESIWPIYGMADSEALAMLTNSGANAQYLAKKLKRGDVFSSVARASWTSIHYAARERLLGIGPSSQAFSLRRSLERFIAERAEVDELHVLVSVGNARPPRPLMLPIIGGETLLDASPISRLLEADVLSDYAVECFVDPQAQSAAPAVANAFKELFINGALIGVGHD